MKSIDQFFFRNTVGVSGVELFWGCAIPVVIESTFLQIFLSSLGASNDQIGLVPSIFALCTALLAPAALLLTAHLEKKKTAIVLAHVISSLPILVFGILHYFSDGSNQLYLFFLLYTLFAALLGFTLPLWQNFLVKIFSPEKTMKALSIMFIFQTVARIIGGLLIAGAVEKFALNRQSSAVVFICAGTLFFAGSFFFLLVKEDDRKEGNRSRHSVVTMVKAIRDIFMHRNFMLFAVSNIESVAGITAISFFAKYAVEIKGVKESFGAGIFSAALFFGAVVASIVFGWVGLFSIKKKYYASKILSALSIVLIILANSSFVFVCAAILLGMTRGINMIAFPSAVKMLSGKEDVTDYFSAFPVIVLPLSFFIPWLAGALVDFLGSGEFAYCLMFSIMALFSLISFFFLKPVILKE